jgi:hypothetical protein
VANPSPYRISEVFVAFIYSFSGGFRQMSIIMVCRTAKLDTPFSLDFWQDKPKVVFVAGSA